MTTELKMNLMATLRRAVICAGAVALLCTVEPVRAQDDTLTYVSNLFGSDKTGDGTLETPYATIQAALDAGHDNLRVLPNKPGTPYGAVTIPEILVGAKVRIESELGPQVTQLRYVWCGRSGAYTFTIVGFTITNPTDWGVYVYPGNSVNLRNCIVAYCGGAGIYSWRPGRCHSSGTLSVRNCVIYGNVGAGIYFYATSTICANSIWIEHGDIQSNIITANIGGGFGHNQGCGWPANSRILVRSNVIHGNILNDTWDCSSNMSVVDHVVTDPLFVDPGQCDFHLATPENPKAETLFHRGNPAFRNPDGTRGNLGAYGGPDSARWYNPGGGRPALGAISLDKTRVDDGQSLKITVRVKVR